MKKVRHILWPAVNSLVSLFFPATCRLCQSVVDDMELGVICESCWRRVKGIKPPSCSQCGYGFPSQAIDPDGALCGSCRRGLFRFDLARSAGPFQEPLKEIIHQFKYRSHPSLARPLAVRLAEVYQAHTELLAADLVIPVPLHRKREKERGFNQAFELSRFFAKLTGLRLEQNWLVRTRATKVQAGLSRRERRLNMNGAFQVSNEAKLDGKVILLLDDVFTTGATLNECARILKQQKAHKVNTLTVARVIRE